MSFRLLTLFEFLFQLPLWNAKLDGTLKVLFSKMLIALFQMKVSTGENHVLILWFQRDRFIQIHDSKFRLFGFCFNLGTYRIQLCLLRVLVNEEREPSDSFLWLVGVLEKNGDTQQGGIVVWLDCQEPVIVSLGI